MIAAFERARDGQAATICVEANLGRCRARTSNPAGGAFTASRVGSTPTSFRQFRRLRQCVASHAKYDYPRGKPWDRHEVSQQRRNSSQSRVCSSFRYPTKYDYPRANPGTGTKFRNNGEIRASPRFAARSDTRRSTIIQGADPGTGTKSRNNGEIRASPGLQLVPIPDEVRLSKGRPWDRHEVSQQRRNSSQSRVCSSSRYPTTSATLEMPAILRSCSQSNGWFPDSPGARDHRTLRYCSSATRTSWLRVRTPVLENSCWMVFFTALSEIVNRAAISLLAKP